MASHLRDTSKQDQQPTAPMPFAERQKHRARGGQGQQKYEGWFQVIAPLRKWWGKSAELGAQLV
ncbi:hypothetical protein [Candidatus Laterigemmans baculatus]|uniref:hypothetical protein n=1 Tax=Candidatus Laterigemmans baculatus TaxID=2770505 RepID=UPI0013DC84E1|nr:hypothetical protein [Candidatus Laterigemmans baculatus]